MKLREIIKEIKIIGQGSITRANSAEYECLVGNEYVPEGNIANLWRYNEKYLAIMPWVGMDEWILFPKEWFKYHRSIDENDTWLDQYKDINVFQEWPVPTKLAEPNNPINEVKLIHNRLKVYPDGLNTYRTVEKFSYATTFGDGRISTDFQLIRWPDSEYFTINDVITRSGGKEFQQYLTDKNIPFSRAMTHGIKIPREYVQIIDRI